MYTIRDLMKQGQVSRRLLDDWLAEGVIVEAGPPGPNRTRLFSEAVLISVHVGGLLRQKGIAPRTVAVTVRHLSLLNLRMPTVAGRYLIVVGDRVHQTDDPDAGRGLGGIQLRIDLSRLVVGFWEEDFPVLGKSVDDGEGGSEPDSDSICRAG